MNRREAIQSLVALPMVASGAIAAAHAPLVLTFCEIDTDLALEGNITGTMHWIDIEGDAEVWQIVTEYENGVCVRREAVPLCQ